MFVKVEKWHGCKNDFIVTWLHPNDKDLVLNSLVRQASHLCDRHEGVGADGILVLHINPESPLTPRGLTIINSDGSTAKNCGNGLRCAAMSIRRAHQVDGDLNSLPELVELDVEGSQMNCRFLETSGSMPFVSIEMPTVNSGNKLPWNNEVLSKVKSLESKFDFSAEAIECFEIGNPHVVVETAENSEQLMKQLGAELQSGLSIDGINVHVISTQGVDEQVLKRGKKDLGQGIGELVTANVWERGVGPTKACGSGACAIGMQVLNTGFVDRLDWVAVDMPGGRLYVAQRDGQDSVTLAGPAEFVFSGSVEI